MKIMITLQTLFLIIILCAPCLAEKVKSPFASSLDRQEFEEFQRIEKEKQLERERIAAEEEAKRIEEELQKREKQRAFVEEKLERNKEKDDYAHAYNSKDTARGDFEYRPSYEEQDVVIELPEFEIQGIVWNVDKSSVIIENKVYFVGDSIADAMEVVSIDKQGVGIMYNGQLFTKKIKMQLKQ